MKVSIIGFGRIGKFMARNLKDKVEVVVTDIEDKTQEAEEINISFVSLKKALESRIIILAVTMKRLEETLIGIKDNIRPGTLALDVCSLKGFSCKLMKKILPEETGIIGTHPLFGPDSASGSISGHKIALCNVRSRKNTFNKVRNFLENLGLNVFPTTPEEHDRQMATSQALTHFVGQIANRMDIKRVDLRTKTFSDLMDIVDVIKNDSQELFENMQTMNPFAREVRRKFIEIGDGMNQELDELNNNENSQEK